MLAFSTSRCAASMALGLALVAPVVELVIAATDPNGLRIGDKMAGTKVYD